MSQFLSYIVQTCLFGLSILFFCITVDAQSNKEIIVLDNIKKANQDVVDLIVQNPYEYEIELIDFKAEYPLQFQYRRKIIPPKSFEYFRVKLSLSTIGDFSKSLDLTFSETKANRSIEFIGTVKKVPPNPLQECPTFDNVPSQQQIARRQMKLMSNIQSRYISLGEVEAVSQKLEKDSYKPNNVVFLLDISSSMKRMGKMELLKGSMEVLLHALRESDRISILSYDTKVEVLMDQVAVKSSDELIAMIEQLEAKGSTNAIEGVDLAMETAKAAFISGGNNQVYLVSDGAFDLDESIKSNIQTNKDKGIRTSVLAIRSSSTARKGMKSLSKLGDGSLVRIDSEKDKENILKDIKKNSAY